MPDWLSVILLGIIEGITEFLPISSTGHLLIAQEWLPQRSELFNFVIQCGAVLAVVVVFTERVKRLCMEWQEPSTQRYLLKLMVAFSVAAVGGLIAKKMGAELPETARPVALATLIGGILILLVERWLRDKPLLEEITWTTAVAVGLAQLAALVFPGTSRSGATILMALALGTSRLAATEFSFLLGVPSLLAAGGYEILQNLSNPEAPSEDWGLVLLGTLTAAITAFAAVKWLLRFIQTHTFVGFGWYRIILGVALLLLLM